MKIKLLFLSIAMLSFISGSIVLADHLYAVTLNEEFISIDSATGAGTLIGFLDMAMDGTGLSNFGSAVYAFDQNARKLRQLDPATGHTLLTIDIGIDARGEGGIAFRSDGICFLVRNFDPKNKLYIFDPSVPESVEAYDMEFCVDGLDFDANGVLYGLSQYSYNLYTIDQTSAEATLIGPTGIASQSFLGGLTFSSDGTLYGILNDALYTLNPNTGAANLIGPIGFENVSGLTTAMPVPDAVLLCGFGIVLFFRLRRFMII
jgi:hypothetical protein